MQEKRRSKRCSSVRLPQPESIETLLREHEARLRPFNPSPRRRVELYGQLCRLYHAWGKPDEAAHWKGMLRREFDQLIAAATREVVLPGTDVGPLIKRARLDGVWTIQTSIFPENRASLALHEACGFRVVGRRERIAKRDGLWRDTLLLEQRL